MRFVCPDCGKSKRHAPTCWAFPGEPVGHYGNRMPLACRLGLHRWTGHHRSGLTMQKHCARCGWRVGSSLL